MRIFQICLLIFVIYGTAPAQFIFIPFEGERKIATIEVIKKENTDVSKFGKPCGDYFLYEEIAGTDDSVQKIVSFMVPVSKEEKNKGTNSFIRIVLKALVVNFDDELKSPTAEWKKNDRNYRQIILRISNSDFEAAKCLSNKPD